VQAFLGLKMPFGSSASSASSAAAAKEEVREGRHCNMCGCKMLPSCSLTLLHPTPAIFPPSPQLLEAIKPLRRGLNASEDDQQRIDRLARALERPNPTKKPPASGGGGGGGGFLRCMG